MADLCPQGSVYQGASWTRTGSVNGAGEESRTLDLNLGKVALYQLSYSRLELLRLNRGVDGAIRSFLIFIDGAAVKGTQQEIDFSRG